MTANTGLCCWRYKIPLKTFYAFISQLSPCKRQVISVVGLPTVTWQSSNWFREQIINQLWGAKQCGYLLPIWMWLSKQWRHGLHQKTYAATNCNVCVKAWWLIQALLSHVKARQMDPYSCKGAHWKPWTYLIEMSLHSSSWVSEKSLI